MFREVETSISGNSNSNVQSKKEISTVLLWNSSPLMQPVKGNLRNSD